MSLEIDGKFFDQVFHQAKEWVLDAGEKIKVKINEPLSVETKSHSNDLITEMDKSIERFFALNIKRNFPTHLLVSEEGYGDNVTTLNNTIWIVDPIDGTMNFVHQKRNFAISLAVFHQGIGEFGLIYDVMENILYSARKNCGAYKNDIKLKPLTPKKQIEKSILSFKHELLCENALYDRKVIENLVNQIRSTRLRGSAALEIAHVAEGITDGYISKELSPWDIAAGMIIIKEVEGEMTRSNGEYINLLEKGSILVCNPGIHKKIVSRFLKNWLRK